MSKSSEEISQFYANSGAKPDSNLSNDSLHLGGIEAEEYATKKYVQDYHGQKEDVLKEQIENKDKAVLNEAKSYADLVVAGQDFSNFAKLTDVQALDTKLQNKISSGDTEQKNYTDTQIKSVVDDVNANFDDVNTAITKLNDTTTELFQSVSNGKAQIAGAITDKGVTTSANATFNQMATNIRNIPSGGSSGGGGESGGIDTSDATATASDILKGKTAYVKGQKVYGRYIAPSGYENNPNDPYPTYSEVEVLYKEKPGEMKVSDDFSIPSNITMYDITASGGMMFAYYQTENKFKILKQTPTGFVQVKSSDDELVTPEYTLTELGIAEDDTILGIKFGKMNDEETFSRYDTMLAIATRKNDESDTQLYVHVYRFYTGSYYKDGEYYEGKVYIENEVITYGIDEETTTQTLYNKWLIKTGQSYSEYSCMKWSPYSFTLAVGVGIWCNIMLYQFDKYLPDEEDSNYGRADLKTSFNKGNSGSAWFGKMCDISFLNNDRIVTRVNLYNYSGTTYQQDINIIDENYNFIKKTYIASGSLYAITNNGLYAVKGNVLYSLVINYVTGDVTFNQIGTIDVTFNYLGINGGFSENNTLFFSDNHAYNIDFINMTCTQLSAETYNYITTTSNLKKFLVKDSSGYYHYIYVATDEKEVIGLKYNGDVFYKQVYPAGTLTAGQPDVRAGKTFIGWLGIPETGTMEVSE